MKIQVSLKGRGKKMKRRGRMAQGYFCRRKGILRFYPFDDSSIGKRVKSRQPISKARKAITKY